MELPAAVDSPYYLLLTAAISIPIYHYLLGVFLFSIVSLYNFLEMHFFQDLFTGFKGQSVKLTFSPSCQLYHDVVSKCLILHKTYLSTPWLCSPHLQTAFLHFFGNEPVVNYRRQIFLASDGGTIALDWVINTDDLQNDICYDEKNRIMIIVPGLTSASHSGYVKHLASKMAKSGWTVVVSNHRGFGGVPITSDRFYNAGWTEDLRNVIDNIQGQYPDAPLFAVGTSIGANMLIKYLGEDGMNSPLIGAAAICCPWDLLIGDRFMNRRIIQRFYNRTLAIGLKKYAHKHEPVFSRLSNWEGVKRSASIREFDDYSTRIVGNFETVDTFYRRSSCSSYVGSVTVPLLCLSSLDDPVCTKEAIPWDECRGNGNIVLATTQHGGHLPFFEGLTANSIWWVSVVEEYLNVLQSSPLGNRKKQIAADSSINHHVESSIDETPFIRVSGDGMITAAGNELDCVEFSQIDSKNQHLSRAHEKLSANLELNPSQEKYSSGINFTYRQNKRCFWLLACVGIITSWPVVGSALALFFTKTLQ